MRMPITASRSDEASRSISSATPLALAPAAASWVSLAWAITSSPTWSIISSSRSAWTRMVANSLAPFFAAPSAADSPAAGGGARGREGGRDGGDGRRRGALLDAEFHVAGDEDEDVLDLALWMGGLEQNVPGEVAGGRVHLVERRRRLDVDRDPAVAERRAIRRAAATDCCR